MNKWSLKRFAKEFLKNGMTHLLAEDGTKTSLQDIASGKIRYTRTKNHCFWFINGALGFPNLTLYDKMKGASLGYYKIIREKEEENAS